MCYIQKDSTCNPTKAGKSNQVQVLLTLSRFRTYYGAMADQPEVHFLRKADGIEVHTVAQQVAVFDPRADLIHYLNPTAALILELTDGLHSSHEIAALVQEAYGLTEAPVIEVEDCLSGLQTAGLVH